MYWDAILKIDVNGILDITRKVEISWNKDGYIVFGDLNKQMASRG